MPIVIHHPVLSKTDSTRFVDPAWADHGLLQAYRLNGVEDAKGGTPDSGGSLYNVHADNLPQALSDGAILLADDLRDTKLGKVARSAIEDTWGITIPGDVQSPLNAIVRVVGRDAHPDGLLGPRPIMPGSDGKFRWVVGRNEIIDLVPVERFFPASDRDNSHFAPRSHVRDVMLEGVKEALARDEEHGAKMAGMNLLKFGIPRHEVANFATEMIPVEFRGVKPRNPETRFDLTFTAADGATVAGFTKVAGAWSIASNKLENDTPGANANTTVRYDSALSGDDHLAYCDVTWEGTTSFWAGVCCRYNASAFTCYLMNASSNSDDPGLNRINGGISTNMITTTLAIGAQTSVVLLRCDGSALYGSIGTNNSLAFTNTTIPSNTQFGLYAYAQTTGVNHKFDNLTAEDFSGGGTVARLINGGRVHV